MSLEDQQQRRRERQRRWRQSVYGKARLKAKYQERKRLLDGIKAKASCQRCREHDPKVLSFVPRPGQKVKFPPRLENITRSLVDWKEVIAASDVLCRNCLAKRKRPARRSVSVSRIPKTPLPMASFKSLTISSGPGGYHPRCKFCKVKLGPKNYLGKGRRREFCSDRCRLLFWAIRKLLDVAREGRAPGLSDVISELGGLES